MAKGSGGALFVSLLFVLLVLCTRGLGTPLAEIVTEEDYQKEMFWGSYRPGIYFGMKTRSEVPISTGIMWSSGKGAWLRHTCRHEDSLRRYGWTRHNGRDFGQHEAIDELLNANMVASFVKEAPRHSSGGSWATRLRVRPLQTPTELFSAMYYIILPSACRVAPIKSKKKGLDDVIITGWCPEVEEFTFLLSTDGKETFPSSLGAPKVASLRRTSFLGLSKSDADSWDIHGAVEKALQKSQRAGLHRENGQLPEDFVASLPNTAEKNSNVFIFQRVSLLPVTIDAAFLQHESLSGSKDMTPQRAKSYFASLSGSQLTEKIRESAANFDNDFERVFHLQEAQGVDNSMEPVARAAFSNMMGGMGYWFGDWLIYQGPDQPPLGRSPQALFSACPSRPFFPRGFLWDEGFHQLLLSEWQPQLTVDVLTGWINLMQESGWIPREQILGAEARGRVPEEYRAQHPDHANPPTFFLAIDKLLRRYQKKVDKLASQVTFQDGASIREDLQIQELIEQDPQLRLLARFFKSAFPRLVRWHQWFLETQEGPRPGLLRWRGRTKDHLLSSGLDDYPRGNIPSEQEAHLDLLCWMILSSRTLAKIAHTIGEDPAPFNTQTALFTQGLESHWDSKRGLYSDISNVSSFPLAFSPHVGYVNLFPLMLGLLPADSARIPLIYQVIRDPLQLWTRSGLRSLSKSDEMYQKGENYWRGPIWMNLNYLLLSGLRLHYFGGSHEAESRQLYYLLRGNLIRNVVGQYQSTGYFWEQYHEESGLGTHSHPFTGWTALILNIMSESY